MARVKFNLRGLEEIAKRRETADAVRDLAEKVADNVRSQGHMVSGIPGDEVLPVTVNVGETKNMRVNRAKAWVTLAHPAGLAVQAKHGALTKAASEAGLEVKGN